MTQTVIQQKWNRLLWRACALSMIFTMLLSSALLADDTDTQQPDGPSAIGEVADPGAVTADDGGSWEVGIHGTAGNLTQATAAERYGMWVWLNGWFVRRYSYAEASAWEEDFKKSSRGGKENSYLDTVDLQFYVGHGAPGLFTFDNTAHDDSTLSAPIDCSSSWGDGDNEWLALTSCQVLSGSGLGAMAQCMNRQHLILGFVTNASAHNNYWDTQAYHFGRYMRYNNTMTQAWFKACDVAQRGRTTRVIAEETACFNDNPYQSSVCADVIDNDYYWYTHSCGTESATYVPIDQMADTLPVFKVDPYGLAEATAEFRELGSVFDIPVEPAIQAAGLLEDGDPPTAPSNSPFLVSSNVSKTLELDKGSGIYNYSDLGQLWTDSSAQTALAVTAASANYINNDDARRIADSFLQQNGLMTSDAVFYEVVSDTVGTLAKDSVVSASLISAAETPSMWQVIYSRKLTVPVVMAAGGVQDIEFTIVGPGAKQKVYVPVTGQVTAAGVDANPVGVQGGWRGVSPAVNAANEQVYTTIIDDATARALYIALDKQVTMNSIPIAITDRNVLSSTLAYWESAPGNSQGELIPVYELTVGFTEVDTGNSAEDLFYVPASSQYLPPAAQIVNAPTEGVDSGDTLTVSAADATKTLKELGAGDAFDFVMGYNGADGTYTYEWYLGNVAPENKITDLNTTDGGTNLTFTVPRVNDDRGGTLELILVVTDIESPNRSTGTANAQIVVNPAIFLPFVAR
ncbi:MAG: DUF6345 domain-containing protein [Caldilineaceae bacterium]